MREPRVLLYCLLMCVTTGIAVHSATMHEQKKIAVVDAVRLFDTYTMKRELEDIAKVQLQKDSRQLDSIDNKLQKAKGFNNKKEIGRLEYVSNMLKTKLNTDYTRSNEEITTQVWKRLNQLLNEFGKRRGIT